MAVRGNGCGLTYYHHNRAGGPGAANSAQCQQNTRPECYSPSQIHHPPNQIEELASQKFCILGPLLNKSSDVASVADVVARPQHQQRLHIQSLRKHFITLHNQHFIEIYHFIFENFILSRPKICM